MNRKFITAREAAPKLLTSEAQVFEWVRNGTLSAPVACRINRKILIDSDELEIWLRNGGTLKSRKSE